MSSELPAPVVSLSGVRLWRGETMILDGIDWAVRPGEHWALIGPNGCGKTTLLKIVSGWLFPSRGRVQVLGRTFGECNMEELRKEIGWVSNALLGMIPKGLIALGAVLGGKRATLGISEEPTDAELEEVKAHLDAVGCLARWELPFGLLSQGEQMRVLIARALMRSPRLLILDEPCTGLDPVARDAFLGTVEALIRARPELTVILVTHHLEEIIPAIGQVLALRAGKTAASGPKKTVLTGDVLETVFGTPFEVHRTGHRWHAHPLPDAGSIWHVV